MTAGQVGANWTESLDRLLSTLVNSMIGVEAAAVVSFDGLPMASALPPPMEEGRVAAMSAALLSLGERAAEGLGRGALSQVYIEGHHGTVALVSCGNEAVLVAVASKTAKAGLVLYELRRSAAQVAAVLREEPSGSQEQPVEPEEQPPTPVVEPEPPAPRAPSAWEADSSVRKPSAWPAYAPTGTVLPGRPASW